MTYINSYVSDLFGHKTREAEYVDRLPSVSTIDDGSLFIIKNFESRYLTHKFHKYAGKFVPEVPAWALRNFLPSKPSSLVVDPFVGSGTTLVEASLHPVEAVGVDIDPLARLIAKVKTTPIDATRLNAVVEKLLSNVECAAPAGPIPEIPTVAHWFNEKCIEELSTILGQIEEHREDAEIYDFLTVCFSSIIRRASNADNQTMKTYVSHTHPKTPESAIALFKATLTDYSERLLRYSSLRDARASTRVLAGGDARSLATTWVREGLPRADLAITSPPYIKSVDYIYNQMAELFWIGSRWDLETQPKQNEFKRRYMGSDRPEKVGHQRQERPCLPSEAEAIISLIRMNNEKLAGVAERYFSDTINHFDQMKEVLVPSGRYVYVVGDSTLASVAVPTHELVIRCAERAGFTLELGFGYEIRNKHMRFPRGLNGGQVAHDWVLTFRASEANIGVRRTKGAGSDV